MGAALAVLAVAATASAQTSVAGGPHDFSAGSAIRNTDATINGQTCVFCHTPHMGSVSVPLWNRSGSTATYQVYASSTLDTAAPTSAAIQSSVSGACLSCHDGSIAIDVLTNLNGVAHAASVAFTRQATAKATYGNNGTGTGNILAGGTPFLGTDLRNDHPPCRSRCTARRRRPPRSSAPAATIPTTTPWDRSCGNRTRAARSA